MRFSLFVSTLLAASVVHARMEKRCTARHAANPSVPVNAGVEQGDNASSASNNTSSAVSSTTRSATSTKASASSASTSSASSSGNSTSSNTQAKNASGVRTYKVSEQYSGISFFDGFNFETFADPTHGNVNYVNADTAYKEGLAYVDKDNTVIMKVDNTKTIAAGGNRDSVRITSKNSYTKGLIVLDVQAMPYGCGVWPAFWTVGDSWPNGGEIDIVEGVNNQANAQYTLHTASGCNLDTSFQKSSNKKRHHRVARGSSTSNANSISAMAFTGKVLSTTCDANINSNTGCGIQDSDNKSLSAGLNNRGGGVFATLIDDSGVAIWFFPRDSIPDDLDSETPQPSTWGSPKAFWSSSLCPTKSFFGAQRIVINTTLCGDWAGATYNSDGCSGTCAQRLADPSNFDNAQWKINSVTVYN